MRLLRYLSLALLLFILSVNASAEVVISVNFAPPALPVYEQPPCPAAGYIWVPGYWAYDYDFDDYYWVPGTWVLAPEPGYLWTPPYWAWNGAAFVFYEGYWGPIVGFYGGIDYGFGYFGEGYRGGRWEGSRFFYNRAVNNINVTNITNVYNETTVINNTTVNRVSYNGGPGGVAARPTPQQEEAAHQRHIPPVAAQTQQVQTARSEPQLRSSANQGRPPIAATPRPTEFRGGGVVQAREAGAPYHRPANRGARASAARGNEPANHPSGFNQPVPRPENSRPAIHPNDLPPLERAARRDSGNTRADQKYEQQQEKLYARQQQDRQKLQLKQDQEHQKLARQNVDQARQQQMEQRHQQQTRQMVERHQTQRQKLEGPPRPH